MTGLQNKRIALAEARELDLLANMLEREGAVVLRCPLVSILDAPDAAPIEAWIRRVIAGHCQDAVFYTGEGLRRLIGFADRARMREPFITALSGLRKITRGPKPVRALREVGLSPDLTAETPTTDGLIATLQKENLKDRGIGVQVYGQEPNAQLVGFLNSQGAKVDIVAPYIYASAADDTRVQSLIRDLDAGMVDAVAFTSSPQIKRLEDVAAKAGLGDALRRGLERTKVAAVGPVMVAELAQWGIRADTVPDNSFTMKPLVKAIARLF